VSFASSHSVVDGRAIQGHAPPAGSRRVLPPRAPDGSMPASGSSPLFALRFRALWEFIKRQPTSFKLVCLYLFMEYVRPQQLYSAIAFVPYSKIIIVLAVLSFFLEGRAFRIGLPESMLAVFSISVLMSSLLAVFPDASYDQLSLYISWVVIYLLIANTLDTEERFLVFLLSFILYSFKMAEFGTRSWAEAGFHFRDWGINGAPGWFNNSGEFGIQM
jgi:putative inorganic carbon (HCO3(-)) transporter